LHLGEGVPGEILTGCICLRNTGAALLVINSIQPGCGCASWKLARKEIPPGEAGALQVTARLTKEGEELFFPVHIFSNDPDFPVISHSVLAKAPAFLRTLPDQVTFGDVPPRTASQRELVLVKPGGEPWPVRERLEWSLKDGDSVQIERKGVTAATGEGLVLTIRLRPDLPAGDFADTVIFRHATDNRTIEVPISGSVVPAVRPVPSVLYFGSVGSRGPVAERRLLLRRTDGGNLGRVVKVHAPSYLQVEPQELSPTRPDTRFLIARLTGIDPPDTDSREIVIWHEGQDEPVRVPIIAAYQGNRSPASAGSGAPP
jgi:hypothetical protein